MYDKNCSYRITIRISEEDLDYITDLAEINGKSVSEILRLLIKSVRLEHEREGVDG